jgi:hypothetical protein
MKIQLTKPELDGSSDFPELEELGGEVIPDESAGVRISRVCSFTLILTC